ncbi:MAG: YbhB/YbcL family Raf kinase inhibitor-like protein [Candidatus Hydrogenedentes bacterium]|nr:YbhB/YbcL family Raf kinase inhibitor-like protein [Candidatus Hydrogenedentota bacterium]
MDFKLTSPVFQEGAYIPKKHTGEGPDASPQLKWTDPPAGTKSLALICDDPDAPVGTWVHWVIWGIKPDARELPEGVPTKEAAANGTKQGINDFKKIGYGGPMPPRGSDHRYFFKLYALDTEINLAPGATKKALLDAMKGHVLAETQIMGRYKR